MIGITKLSPGRMGNRLFHYHLLRQIARKTGANYFHCKLPDSVYFEEMEKRPKLFFQFRKSLRLTSTDVLTFNPQDFLAFVAHEAERKNIFFDPPMLGEVFFDYLFYAPGDFVKVKMQYNVNFNFDFHNKVVIGIHFRGTDFPEWNEHAALKFPYYRDAVLYCLEFFRDENPVFILFTDDNNYPAFTETVSFLKSLHDAEFYFGDPAGKPISDFCLMTQCDVLISSPSTFAIFAGCLGKPKKIIHDNSWLNCNYENADTFWIKLKYTDNPHYSLWKTF
ncbi:MAG: alpha-1,2-fucosyltransferase [Firmicutes bacterium]|nr:alpha-1,2-fucosyltransferase [Bacillota bacterium]